MCIIIIKQEGRVVPTEVAKTSARINPHGLGIIWLDTFEVSYHKSSQYSVLETNRPFIAHFRYATVGAINKENTHPFQCGSNKQEWLMMNGTIPTLGNAKVSDSKVLAQMLGDVPRHKWKEKLAKFECRFVTVNTRTRTFQMYNKELWTQRDGVWYSKANVLEDHLVAVYGTLKKGYSNYNRYLYNSKYIASGQTQDKYPLIISGLPFLIENSGQGHNVDVDVFKVSDAKLADLDRLEGHPTWYRRKQIPVQVKGKTLMCWIYFNIKEKADGKVWHKTYTQSVKPYSYYFEDELEESSYVDLFPKQNKDKDCEWLQILQEVEDEKEFDVENELPVCVECYNDLEHDGFANYYCCGCGGWFAEDEVLYSKS